MPIYVIGTQVQLEMKEKKSYNYHMEEILNQSFLQMHKRSICQTHSFLLIDCIVYKKKKNLPLPYQINLVTIVQMKVNSRYMSAMATSYSSSYEGLHIVYL